MIIKTWNTILNYPKLLKKFLFDNSGLLSSTSAEHLFNTGGNMSLKIFSLTDNMFETSVMLKQNKICI